MVCSIVIVVPHQLYKVRDKDIFDKNVVKEVDFLEIVEGQLRLKRSHEYYAQVQGQMWVFGVQQSYFIVWTPVKKPLYEKILFDAAYCESLVNKLTIFYRTYVLPCLLGFRKLLECAKCDKVILQEAEINNPDEERSITCFSCKTCWHLCCAQLTESTAKTLDNWLCFNCLVDLCDPAGDFDDGTSSSDTDNPEDEDINVGASTSSALNPNDDFCSVCFNRSIPVGGTHVCSIYKKKVHAWCSNHEDISNSANLVCNSCQRS